MPDRRRVFRYELMDGPADAVQHVLFFTLFFFAILASSMGPHALWYSLLVTLAQLFVPWKLILLYVSTAILVGKCVASISDRGITLRSRLTVRRLRLQFGNYIICRASPALCATPHVSCARVLWYT